MVVVEDDRGEDARVSRHGEVVGVDVVVATADHAPEGARSGRGVDDLRVGYLLVPCVAVEDVVVGVRRAAVVLVVAGNAGDRYEVHVERVDGVTHAEPRPPGDLYPGDRAPVRVSADHELGVVVDGVVDHRGQSVVPVEVEVEVRAIVPRERDLDEVALGYEDGPDVLLVRRVGYDSHGLGLEVESIRLEEPCHVPRICGQDGVRTDSAVAPTWVVNG